MQDSIGVAGEVEVASYQRMMICRDGGAFYLRPPASGPGGKRGRGWRKGSKVQVRFRPM